MMRRKIKYLPLFILLFLSIGFAILSSTLSIGSNMAISSASFDVHLEDAKIYQSNVSNNSQPVINAAADSISMNLSLDKPGDYVIVCFSIVNSGTIDAQLNEFIVTPLTEDEANYLTYSYKYSTDVSLDVGDLIGAGQTLLVYARYEYKYDVDSLINISNKNIDVTLKYVQPNNYDYNVWNFYYANKYQEFTATRTGDYKVELWGASGEKDPAGGKPGYGAYTAGVFHLIKNDKYYIYVGNVASIFKHGIISFNGGSDSQFGGGGATDIRIVSGSWNNFNSLKSRIMVAAGGGAGNDDCDNAGSAGGLVGYNGHGNGANQIRGGISLANGGFGFGGGTGIRSTTGNGGGGSGYFGGACSDTAARFGGAGGSSFISGHAGCVAIDSASTENNIIFKTDTNEVSCDSNLSATYNTLGYNTDPKCSIHYSNKVFTNTVMIDGNGYKWTTEKSSTAEGMPTKDGTGTMTGNSGDGYAKITYMG